MAKKEFTYEIVQYLGVLSQQANNWQKEFNLISWNGGKPKYDIRSWSSDHTQMSKGVSFNEEEIKLLKTFLEQK